MPEPERSPYNVAFDGIMWNDWGTAGEKLVLLVLAHYHANGHEWVSAAQVAKLYNCSPQNAGEFLRRPRPSEWIEQGESENGTAIFRLKPERY